MSRAYYDDIAGDQRSRVQPDDGAGQVEILVIILLAFIVHWAGGGLLNLRLGHFVLNVGFT